MIHSQNTKHYMLVKPQSIGTTAVTGTIDTDGFDRIEILTEFDTAATSVTVGTLKLSEGDTTAAYTDITEFTAGTAAGNFTAPAASGTDATGQFVAFDADLRKRKRYLKVTLANSGARISAVTATLSRGGEVPNTDSERGCAEVVYG